VALRVPWPVCVYLRVRGWGCGSLTAALSTKIDKFSLPDDNEDEDESSDEEEETSNRSNAAFNRQSKKKKRGTN
jgi:hypothetical protein